MAMTPQQIQEKHFHDSFRGYSHEEVDLFLDEVAEAFEKLFSENQALQRRLTEVEEQLAQGPIEAAPQRRAVSEEDSVSEGTLKRMLVIAQETADKAVQDARARARATLERAEAKARELEDQARLRADSMISQAETKLRELGASTVQRQQELERAKEALAKFDREYRAQFRQFIESQLEALEDFALTAPRPVGLSATSPPVPRPSPEVPPLSAGDATQAMPGSKPSEKSDNPQSKELPGGPDVKPTDSASSSRSPAVSASRLAAPPPEIDDSSWKPDDAGGRGRKANVESTDYPASRKDKASTQNGVTVNVNRVSTDKGSPEKSGPNQSDTKADEKTSTEEDDDKLIRELFWGED